MAIRVDPHTLARAEERGTTEEEIRDVILFGSPTAAKHGRQAKAKVYAFGRVRQGKRYEQKRVEVIFNADGRDIVTVTVYVFYGKWE
jgi:hypothetical protein